MSQSEQALAFVREVAASRRVCCTLLHVYYAAIGQHGESRLQAVRGDGSLRILRALIECHDPRVQRWALWIVREIGALLRFMSFTLGFYFMFIFYVCFSTRSA